MSLSRPGTTRFAVRGTARIAYEIAGAARNDAAAPAVLLHALLGSRADLAPLRDALGAARRVLLADARGHGASAALANQRYTVADMAAEVLAALDAEAVPSAHLIGHGLGGTAAFEVARSAPGRVRSLTLIEPSLAVVLDDAADPAAFAARQEARATERAAADAAYKGLTDKALDALLAPRSGRNWRDHLARPRLAAIRRHAGSLAGTLAALDNYVVDRNDITNVAVPALIVADPDATPVVRLTCERLAALLPHARLEVWPLAALAPHVAATAEDLVAGLTAFLEGVEAD